MTKPLCLGAAIAVVVVTAAAHTSGGIQAPPSAKPTFEVASVKPNTSADSGASFGIRPGGQLVVRNNTLRNMIRNAFQVQNFQITGGPAWFDTLRFDITAKAPTANPTMEEFMAMTQALLVDRFKLVIRRESRDIPVYGPRLTRGTVDCAALAEAARRGSPPPAPRPDGGPQCGTRNTPGHMIASGVTMADLARNISNFAGRMTVDRTGLVGRFDLDLEYTPDQMPPPGAVPPDVPRPTLDGPSLFTAVQEQLGLKLDSQRAPADLLVIDSASEPMPD
jgi:bla regulator protein BlaR1